MFVKLCYTIIIEKGKLLEIIGRKVIGLKDFISWLLDYLNNFYIGCDFMKNLKIKVTFVIIAVIVIFTKSNIVYADNKLKNTTRIYFASGVTKGSGQRRLYFTRKLW